MSSDQHDSAVGQGEIHTETGAGLAGMTIGGIFFGLGMMIFAASYDLVSFDQPPLSAGICIAGGIVICYISLKRVPDARTVAIALQEEDYFDQ